MTSDCKRCGICFEARGSWQKLCWDCWQAKKLGETYDRGYVDGLRAGAQKAAQQALPVAPLDSGLLRDLVQLSHPDRDPPERAELANRATAILLSMLDREAA